MSAFATMGTAADPRWTGIAEVFVSGLGGAVRWKQDEVVLELPDLPHDDRVADLDSLTLCLVRIGLPVVFDPSRSTSPDVSLRQFQMRLVDSGLTVDVTGVAA